jgi:hypothetical protein
MNSPTFLATLLLVLSSPLVGAQETNAAPSTQPLVPVNQMSRFLLLDSMPHLAGGMAGLTQDTIILRSGEFRCENQTVITQVPEAHGRETIWVQMNDYWIEPVTPPPSQGDPVVVPIDDMRVAEVQGEVTLTLVTPKHAKPEVLGANENMEVPDGAVVTTADSGSAAIMVGGHTSIRLVPNSRIVFHYDPSGTTSRVEVQILQGGVFCKVGKLPTGRYADVAVRGQVGAVASIGSADFFVLADPVSVHACLIQGRLLVGNSIPLTMGNMDWYPPDVQADNHTGPQICHWPRPASTPARITEDALLLNLALHQVRSLNVKLNALLNGNGDPLSSDDQAYLAKIPRITWYAMATAEE